MKKRLYRGKQTVMACQYELGQGLEDGFIPPDELTHFCGWQLYKEAWKDQPVPYIWTHGQNVQMLILPGDYIGYDTRWGAGERFVMHPEEFNNKFTTEEF